MIRIYPAQPVTIHFDLAPGLPFSTLPGGTLTISESAAPSEPVCQAAVTGVGVGCTLTFSTAGSHTLIAAYSGDRLYEPSDLSGFELKVEAEVYPVFLPVVMR